mmetsp:Transcript_93477/g.180205  ORF Transcript_93477/g.180205 Transcript_93477/m.180205 type:complete len:237 (+) Transcript_93477:63-773(+)
MAAAPFCASMWGTTGGLTCFSNLEDHLTSSQCGKTSFDDEFDETEVSGCIDLKATLVAHTLRLLSERDSRRVWERFTAEFEKQKASWSRSCRESNLLRHEGEMASLKSKLEVALAMYSANGVHDHKAALALEAALQTHDSVERVRVSAGKNDTVPKLNPTMKLLAVEVLSQIQVGRARIELADYLDMCSQFDNIKPRRPRSWFVSIVKACDLSHGVLKEYLNEVFAAEAMLPDCNH